MPFSQKPLWLLYFPHREKRTYHLLSDSTDFLPSGQTTLLILLLLPLGVRLPRKNNFLFAFEKFITAFPLKLECWYCRIRVGSLEEAVAKGAAGHFFHGRPSGDRRRCESCLDIPGWAKQEQSPDFLWLWYKFQSKVIGLGDLLCTSDKFPG